MDRIVDEIKPGQIETRVVLRCDGGYIGAVINNRWLEIPCRQKRCRTDGVQTVHIWDLLTMRKSTVTRPLSPPEGATREGALPNGTLR